MRGAAAVRRQSVTCRVDRGRVTGRRRRTTSSMDAKRDRAIFGRWAEQASSTAEGAEAGRGVRLPSEVLPSQRDPLNQVVPQSSGSQGVSHRTAS